MTSLLLAVTAHAGEVRPVVTRVAGVDDGSKIAYALLSIEGRRVDTAADATPPPRLTAQCTQTATGRLRFEVLADLGAIPDLAYYPPWRPTNGELFPPRLEKTLVTMEFLGYTKVKPVKRHWESLLELPGEMRYQTPGMGSSNLEEVMFYLQYLRALPTLRLSVPGKGVAEWETSKWQAAVHAEPLCRASGL